MPGKKNKSDEKLLFLLLTLSQPAVWWTVAGFFFWVEQDTRFATAFFVAGFLSSLATIGYIVFKKSSESKKIVDKKELASVQFVVFAAVLFLIGYIL